MCYYLSVAMTTTLAARLYTFSFQSALTWQTAEREKNYDLFRLFKVTFRLFAIDNLWFPSSRFFLASVPTLAHLSK